MAIDPSLSFKVLRPDQVDSFARQDKIEQAQVDMIPLKQKQAEQEVQMGDQNLRLKKIEEASALTKRRAQLLTQATSQESWNRVLQQAAAEGEDVSDEPQQFDPNYVKNLQIQAMDISDRLEAERENLLNQANIALKGAQIGTERAQAGAYGALANQRNAAADLNRHNASKSATPGQTQVAKPIPVAALKLQNEALQNLGSITQTNDTIDNIIKGIDSGVLKTDIANRNVSKAMNYFGSSTPQSRSFANYEANLKKMVNDSLLLAKGVQTEGDAQRAADAILAAPYDTQAVKERLQELKRINKRSAEMQKLQVNQIRQNYGAGDLNFDQYEGGRDYSKMSDDDIRKALGK